MEMCDKIMGDVAQEYIIDSNEALQFKLVRSLADMEDEEFFSPEMTHQVYGESEQIYGYRNLQMSLYVSAGRLNMFCDVEHDGIIEKNKPGELEPDELITPLADLLPPNTLLGSLDTFKAMIKKEATFRPYGDQVHRHTREHEGKERVFEVYKCEQSTPGFVDYFERLQMFTMFYVDAASYLDTTDSKWRYFLVFEKYQSPDGNPMYAFVAFTTVYEFYGYPENIRPRISQMLVLPPFQRLGIGTTMLQTVYKTYRDDPKVLTISVEDPSAVFGKMRLLEDCASCLQLPAFSPENLRGGLTNQHFDTARNKLKLNKDCVRSVYNVLLLRATRRSDPDEYRTFRIFIKNQLYGQFRRQDLELSKLRRLNVPAESVNEMLSFVPKEKRPDIIHQQFLETEAKLLAIVERLPKLSEKGKK